MGLEESEGIPALCTLTAFTVTLGSVCANIDPALLHTLCHFTLLYKTLWDYMAESVGLFREPMGPVQ